MRVGDIVSGRENISGSGQRPHGLKFKPWKLPRLAHETEGEAELRRHWEYFHWQKNEVVADWLENFSHLDLKGKTIIDLGCGHGSLAVLLAELGAARVIGVDLDSARISFAQEHVVAQYPHLPIEFECIDIAELDEQVDYIFSKDTFEHIDRIDRMVPVLRRLLVDDGALVVGFGPLYYSPFGDHGRIVDRRLPWLPVVFPEAWLLKYLELKTNRHYTSVMDIGLNKLTPAAFRALFDKDAWFFSELKYNIGRKLLLKPLRLLRKIPMLERYFTVTIFSVIYKRVKN